jgi:membrane protein implicated in regulation of membrane protease activity
MDWWLWIIVGLVLLAAELLTPGGFYLLFFGMSAIVVGLMHLFGIAGPEWLQWLLFSGFSVASIAFLRKPLVDKFSAQGAVPGAATVDTDTLIGEVAVAAEDIASGDIGRVEMRGSAWRACNRSPRTISSGQRCVVERVDGLKLDVHPQP